MQRYSFLQDKGDEVVVLNRLDYNMKLQNILKDKTKFKRFKDKTKFKRFKPQI